MSRQASGLRAWVFQRISAIYLLLFIPYLLVYFIASPPQSHAEWADWIGRPVIGIAVLMFFFALLLHAWVGIRDVIIDYIHPPRIRLALLSLFGVGLIACGFWAMKLVFLAQTL